jgi:hypothetical protein
MITAAGRAAGSVDSEGSCAWTQFFVKGGGKIERA